MSGTIDVYFPILHPKQRVIHESKARFKVLACGRRFGKTDLDIYEIGHRGIRGQRCAYFAPSYKMASEAYRLILYRLGPVVKHASKTEGRIELITGGVIEFWSLSTMSAETVRGRKYHFVVIDEAAMIPNGMIVWDEVIYPMLMDYEGHALFTSTPKGRNYFHTLYIRGMDTNQDEWESFNYPTTANPYIKASEVEKAKKTTVERSFRQEYLAEFLDDAGTVFRGVEAVSIYTPELGPTIGRLYSMGIDWGREHDFTVITVIDIQAMRQVYMERFNQISWVSQKRRVKVAYDHWQPHVAIAEANSIGQVMLDELYEDGMNFHPFYTSKQSKPILIDSLALAVEKGMVGLLNDEIQKLEMQSYESVRLPSGYFEYNAPIGGHDDTVIALGLAYQGANGYTIPRMRQARVKGRA